MVLEVGTIFVLNIFKAFSSSLLLMNAFLRYNQSSFEFNPNRYVGGWKQSAGLNWLGFLNDDSTNYKPISLKWVTPNKIPGL